MNKDKRKPRVPIVGIGFDKDIEISYINIDEGSELVLKDEQGNMLLPSVVTVGDAYLRATKPKVLRQLQADPKDIRLDTKRLLRNQDATLAVDTNYHDFGKVSLCVSASILILYEMEGAKRMANFFHQDCFVFYASSINNPERYGWWDIIKRFMRCKFYDIDKSYSLVVDSDLNELSIINTGEVAIWKHNYLPTGFQLLYASADVGMESYINQAMRICDKRANRVLSLVLPKIDNLEMERQFEQSNFLPLCYVKLHKVL